MAALVEDWLKVDPASRQPRRDQPPGRVAGLGKGVGLGVEVAPLVFVGMMVGERALLVLDLVMLELLLGFLLSSYTLMELMV